MTPFKLSIVALATLTISVLQPSNAAEDTQKETAAEFIQRIEIESIEINKELEAAYWVRQTYITPDTAILAAKAGERGLEFQSKWLTRLNSF